MKIIFFGTPRFSAHVLDFLLQNEMTIQAVISKPDKPKGRSLHLENTPVKALLLEKYPNIPLYQPEKVSDPAFAPTLEAFHADFFVAVAYGEIIKEHLLNMPKKGCINLHTSLLPKYRGAAPIQRAIINGEPESGVTIMHMVKKMDAGDIIKQSTVLIPQGMNFGELEDKLLETGKSDLLDVLKNFDSFPSIPQNHEEATLAPKVELEECEVKWELPANTLHNLVRGTNPEPGAWAWVEIKGERKRLKIFETKISDLQGTPGSIVGYGKQFIVSAGDKSLELLDVQLESKKRMKAGDLMRGIPRENWRFI